jgi:hypothetical protein
MFPSALERLRVATEIWLHGRMPMFEYRHFARRPLMVLLGRLDRNLHVVNVVIRLDTRAEPEDEHYEILRHVKCGRDG